MKLPKINCAICKRHVDKVTIYEDFATNEIVITVKCHGDNEEMRIAPFKLTQQQLYELANSEGVAFDKNKAIGYEIY